jgi:integrase
MTVAAGPSSRAKQSVAPSSPTKSAERFRKVRELAKVRKRITIYDFRHLWISEALMAGVDVFTVAEMAGTSVKMIEQTYGHLRGSHLEDAQRRLDESRRKRVKEKVGW